MLLSIKHFCQGLGLSRTYLLVPCWLMSVLSATHASLIDNACPPPNWSNFADESARPKTSNQLYDLKMDVLHWLRQVSWLVNRLSLWVNGFVLIMSWVHLKAVYRQSLGLRNPLEVCVQVRFFRAERVCCCRKACLLTDLDEICTKAQVPVSEVQLCNFR